MVITHHAYVVRGGGEKLSSLQALLPQPVHHYVLLKWGIDDSRALREHQGVQLAPGERRYFIVQFESITLEAQNALLKVLEEPVLGNHFLLLVPADVSLLPTLLSRCQELVVEDGGKSEDDELLAKEFLQAPVTKRLALVQKLLPKEEALAAAKSFLLQLERLAVQQPQDWSELIKSRQYLNGPGTIPKLVLEHLALTLPTLR